MQAYSVRLGAGHLPPGSVAVLGRGMSGGARERLSLKNPEMSKGVDDGRLPFRRAFVDAAGEAPIVRRTKPQTI